MVHLLGDSHWWPPELLPLVFNTTVSPVGGPSKDTGPDTWGAIYSLLVSKMANQIYGKFCVFSNTDFPKMAP